MGLIRFILILVIIYYAFKLIGRFLFPWFIKHQLKKMQQNQNNSYQQTKTKYKTEEGKVTIHYNKKEGAASNKESGDYIDYEEIKE